VFGRAETGSLHGDSILTVGLLKYRRRFTAEPLDGFHFLAKKGWAGPWIKRTGKGKQNTNVHVRIILLPN
jgi:hypothetical protein